MQSRRRASKDDPDEVSQFIFCIRQRPILYNYKLSPQDRRRSLVAKCWRDVAHEIHGMLLFKGELTPDECRRKWKNLRDTYHQYRLRKSKFKDCLDRWRYTKDLEFLSDIYQPKLKSERGKYLSERNPANKAHRNVNELNTSSMADDDDDEDDTNVSFHKVEDDAFIEHIYEDTIEHVVDVNEVQFCDVEAVSKATDEAYSEVCLYEEGETPQCEEITVDESKFSIIHCGSEDNNSFDESQKTVNLTISNDSDELDLFFRFLKTKIEKLPATDVTAIQIEFLNAVLRKEAAIAGNR